MKFLNDKLLKYTNNKWYSTRKKSSPSRTVRRKTIFRRFIWRLVISKIYLKNKRFISSNSVACHRFKISRIFSVEILCSCVRTLLGSLRVVEYLKRENFGLYTVSTDAFHSDPLLRHIFDNLWGTDTTNDSDDTCCEMDEREKSVVRRRDFW